MMPCQEARILLSLWKGVPPAPGDNGYAAYQMAIERAQYEAALEELLAGNSPSRNQTT